MAFGVIRNDKMVGELGAIVEDLCGEAGIGRPVRTTKNLREAIRDSLPHSAVEGLLRASDLSMRELAASLDLSLRSLQRRKNSGRLAQYESDRIYRLARIVTLAEHFLGHRKRATDWLKRPNHAPGGVAPLQAFDTELGARTVENILGRIGYGGIS